MSAIDTLRDALFGNPPDPRKEPSREGVLAAFTEIQQKITGIVSGIPAYPTVADLPAVTISDDGKQARVFEDPTAANNTYWVVKNGQWVVDTSFVSSLESAVQPLVDEATEAANRAEQAAPTIGGANALSPMVVNEFGADAEPIGGIGVAVTTTGSSNRDVQWPFKAAVATGAVATFRVNFSGRAPRGTIGIGLWNDAGAFRGGTIFTPGGDWQEVSVTATGEATRYGVYVTDTTGAAIEFEAYVFPVSSVDPLGGFASADQAGPLVRKLIEDTREPFAAMPRVGDQANLMRAYVGLPENVDQVGGRAFQWKDVHRALPLTQPSIASRPTFRNGKFDFGTLGYMDGRPSIKLREVKHLPDSALVPFEPPYGGFVSTGAAMRDDRKYVVVNHGASTPFDAALTPTLLLLDEGTLTRRAEYDLTAFGFTGTAQGVGITSESGKHRYWVADPPNMRVVKLRQDATSLAQEPTPGAGAGTLDTLGYEPNSIATDDANDVIFVGQTNGIVRSYSTLDGSAIATITLEAGTQGLDHLCFAGGYLWGTSGANGQNPSRVMCWTTTGGLVGWLLLPHSTSIEGLVVDVATNTIRVFNDGNFHLEAEWHASVLCIYDAELPPPDAWTDSIAFCTIANRNAAGDYRTLFAFGRPSGNSRFGWGIGFSANDTDLQFVTSQAGVTRDLRIANAGGQSEVLVSGLMRADGTMIARINGAAATVTAGAGSMADYTLGYSTWGALMGAEVSEAGAILNPGTAAARGFALVNGSGVETAAEIAMLQEMEGRMAHECRRTFYLPGSHPWKHGAP